MAETKTERKVAVILATDVVGYSTKMEENEEQALSNLKACGGGTCQGLEMNPNFSQAHLEQTYPGAILRFKKGLALAGLS